MSSHYERTGKPQRKIDVYQVQSRGPMRYLHSTNWHRTCAEAKQSASERYGQPVDNLRAFFAKPKD